MDSHIRYEVNDPVATIRFDRPDKLNAFTYPMLREFRQAVKQAVEDPAVVGIVVTGTGRAFCAGLDTSVLSESVNGGETARDSVRDDRLPGLFSYLLEVPKPVIAAINGVAAGGGVVLAAMCDIRFASREASFTTAFSKRGLVAEHGTSWILPRLLGPGRALEILWTSRRFDAEEAARMGLVEFVTEPGDEVDQAARFIGDLAENVSPASIRDTKQMVYRHLGLGYPEALRDADVLTYKSLERVDAMEGAQSFLERRPPSFPRLGQS